MSLPLTICLVNVFLWRKETELFFVPVDKGSNGFAFPSREKFNGHADIIMINLIPLGLLYQRLKLLWPLDLN